MEESSAFRNDYVNSQDHGVTQKASLRAPVDLLHGGVPARMGESGVIARQCQKFSRASNLIIILMPDKQWRNTEVTRHSVKCRIGLSTNGS